MLRSDVLWRPQFCLQGSQGIDRSKTISLLREVGICWFHTWSLKQNFRRPRLFHCRQSHSSKDNPAHHSQAQLSPFSCKNQQSSSTDWNSVVCNAWRYFIGGFSHRFLVLWTFKIKSISTVSCSLNGSTCLQYVKTINHMLKAARLYYKVCVTADGVGEIAHWQLACCISGELHVFLILSRLKNFHSQGKIWQSIGSWSMVQERYAQIYKQCPHIIWHRFRIPTAPDE